MKRVTIQDVARACNVSPSTVSLILNNKGSNFSKQTQDKVIETARRMNYRPNLLAVSLQSGSIKTIGVLVPDLHDSYYSAYVKQIERQAFSHGYNTMVGSSDFKVANEILYINSYIQNNLNGILLIKSDISQSLSQELLLEELLESSPIPIIKIDRDAESVRGPLFAVDHEYGGYLGTKYLLDLGHRRIGFVTESKTLSSTQHKINGIMKCLREHDVTPDSKLFYEGSSSIVSGTKAYHHFTSLGITAVFAFSDTLALGYYRTARENSVLIPRECSLLGFNNSLIGQHIDIPLSTIDLPVRDVSRDAVEWLIKRKSKTAKADGNENGSYLYRPELVVRKSTAPPKSREY